MNGKTEAAFCYDFDGTLSPGNMQEYDFFDALGGAARNFWEEADEIVSSCHADPVLSYMMLMIDRARDGRIRTTRDAFRDYGRGIALCRGVEEWFDRINAYGAGLGLNVNHYIVSSGLREMIEGTAIGGKFRKIYACSFFYDENGAAKWPAVAVNYTAKTQFIFRINKGVEDEGDHCTINQYIPQERRPVPFSRMIYIGDGFTDIPCMKLVKELGGTSIAVYPPSSPGRRREADQLLRDRRVNFTARADYTEGGRLDRIAKAILGRIAAESRLASLAAECEPPSRGRGGGDGRLRK